MMAGTNNTSQWKAPNFSFSAANKAEEQNTFYIRALNYLKTLDINIDTSDQTKKGWKQVKMMFTD